MTRQTGTRFRNVGSRFLSLLESRSHEESSAQMARCIVKNAPCRRPHGRPNGMRLRFDDESLRYHVSDSLALSIRSYKQYAQKISDR